MLLLRGCSSERTKSRVSGGLKVPRRFSRISYAPASWSSNRRRPRLRALENRVNGTAGRRRCACPTVQLATPNCASCPTRRLRIGIAPMLPTRAAWGRCLSPLPRRWQRPIKLMASLRGAAPFSSWHGKGAPERNSLRCEVRCEAAAGLQPTTGMENSSVPSAALEPAMPFPSGSVGGTANSVPRGFL